jgi:hypothetical protein
MPNPVFSDVWANAAEVTGDAEVILAGTYHVRLVKAGVSSDRLWTLYEVLAGELAGTRFFGSKYGLVGGDADKSRKAQGFFKGFMIACGIDEVFFANAAGLDDFASAIEGVEGNAKVKVREFADKATGETRQSNDVTAFAMTSRPPITAVGGVPIISTPVVPPAQDAQQAAPALPQKGPVVAAVPGPAPEAVPTTPGAPLVAVPSTPVEAAAVAPAVAVPGPVPGVPGTPDGPPSPGSVTVAAEPNF